ncbi:CHAT domain-containing protein [Mycena sanguinolenta]|nr:CHAT domain-containing protein [Mycena sanguinolenta]
MLKKCKEATNIPNLNTAIFLLRIAVRSWFPRHPELRECLNLLATALLTRFSYICQLEDVHQACHCRAGAAVSALGMDVPGNFEPYVGVDGKEEVEDNPQEIMRFSAAILSDFLQSVDSVSLDTSILLLRQGLSVPPAYDAKRLNSLHALANALVMRFHITSQTVDLEESVALFQEIQTLHPNRAVLLAAALLIRVDETPERDQLEEAMPLLMEAKASDQKAFDYHNAACDFEKAFKTSRNPLNLDVAISQSEMAVSQLSWGHPARARMLSTFSDLLACRFAENGDSTDLEISIKLSYEALAHLSAEEKSDRADFLYNLAKQLDERFTHQGDPTDLDNAIDLSRESIAMSIPDDKYAWRLNNLGGYLHKRFRQRRDPVDLQYAIELHRRVLDMRPASHPDRAVFLGNLACALHTRFDSDEAKDPADLESAIRMYREALVLFSATNPFRGRCLSNLCTALQDTDDLDSAITVGYEAMELLADTRSVQGSSMIQLGIALHMRFKKLGNAVDLDRAIEISHKNLALLIPPHPDRGIAIFNLGTQFMSKYEITGESYFLAGSIHALRHASAYRYFPLSLRYMAARRWVSYAVQGNHESALEAFQNAIEFLPQLVSLGIDMETRQKALTWGSEGLAVDAAACAIRLNKLPLAIEFLESGRSVFWSQTLQLRTSLHDLYRAHPEMAQKCSEIMNKLKHGSHREVSLNGRLPAHVEQHIGFDAEAKNYRKLNDDWLQILHDIRQLDGFQHFLVPKRFTELVAAAVNGPVVILNAGTSSCVALIVTSLGDLQCVPLPDISLGSARFLADLLQRLPGSTFQIAQFVAQSSRDHASEPGSALKSRLIGKIKYKNRSPDETFGLVLAELWRSVVKPVLSALKSQKAADPPRLWWCPTGPFTFLPIHAAGLYEDNSTDCLSDYFISSYTPTLSALLDPPTHMATPFKMTAIIQPDAANLAPLPATKIELTRIKERVPAQWLTSLGLPSPVTVDDALSHLQRSCIVHFACHGVQDPVSPMNSGLVLNDGLLKISKIMRKAEESHDAQENLRFLKLSFLSACETAKGDEVQPDEAVHLAAALLFAGFRSVVGTLWTMADNDGPNLVDTFYEHLFRKYDAGSDSPILPDLTEAATALHLAVIKLRTEHKVQFMRWVPFVHYGL